MEDVTIRKGEQEQARLLVREQAGRVEAKRANRRKDEFLALGSTSGGTRWRRS